MARREPWPAAVLAEPRRTHMHRYDPKVGKAEDVGGPSTDEGALEMLSISNAPSSVDGPPTSSAFPTLGSYRCICVLLGSAKTAAGHGSLRAIGGSTALTTSPSRCAALGS